MNTNKLFKQAGILCLAGAMLMGCKGDDPVIDIPAGGKGDLAVLSMLTNPDGQSGTSWLQMVDGIAPKTVDNAKSHQIGFGTAPLPVWGNDIFTIPDYGSSNTFQKWTRQTDGTLVKGPSLELPTNSFGTHGVIYSAEKGYISTALGKLLIFNPTTMKLIYDSTTTKPSEKSIDLMPYALEAGHVPHTGSLLIDGDLMYVPLWHISINRMPTGDPLMDILVVDIKTDKVIKRIQDKSTGLTNPAYPYGAQKGVFKDEKGDIYMIVGGAFSTNPKYQTGLMRIKKGTQEIDRSYNWVMNDHPIEGEKGTGRWFVTGYYIGNGKLYGLMDVPTYWADPQRPNWLRDRSVIAVEIDIYQKTIKKLPIPHTCCYATHIAPYNNLLLFSVWGENSTGFYTFDPKTGQASSKAVIEMTGFPFWCHQFK